MYQHPVFHVNHFSPWSANNVNGSSLPPPLSIMVEDDLEYEVESILDSHKFHNQYQYLVKWKGYDAGHNSWEPATHLTHSMDIVNAFHKAHPSAPHQLAASLFAALLWRPHCTTTNIPPCLNWELDTYSCHRNISLKEGVM